MDPNLKNFAVFVNSSSSVNKTTQKSDVQIPLATNLAPSDPTKALLVMLSQFRFTNSIYNIDESKNTLRIACEFAPGRGYAADEYNRLWQTWTVKVPVGYYNTQELVSYLSQPGSIYPEDNTGPLTQFINKVGYESIAQRFEYAGIPANPGINDDDFPPASTFISVFAGFGAIPADTTDPIQTPGVVTADNGTRTIFQSPDLQHLIQPGTDITTPCINILQPGDEPDGSTLDFSFVYKGIYLLFDNETAGLLKVLGYFNIDRIPAPVIPDYHTNAGNAAEARGYGIGLEADTVFEPFPDPLNPATPYNSVTMRVASQNTTYYKVAAKEGRNQGIVEVPDFATPVGFNGYFYATQLPSTGLVMYVLYEANVDANNYIFLDPGFFIAGVGVTVPNPFIVDFISTGQILALTSAAAGEENLLRITAANFTANNGYGLTVGSPLTLDSNVVDQEFDVNTSLFGYYVVGIDNTADPVIVALNDDLPAFYQTFVSTYAFMTSIYTLNSAQPGSNTIGTYTNWVATLLSLNDRTGRLVPNLLTNLEGVGEVHVHCAQLRTQYLSSINFQALAPSDVICVIPVDAPFGSAQSYQPPVTLVAYLTNTNIVTLNVQLTDAAGKALDFNGLDWSMVLKCEEVEILSDVEQNTSGTLNTVFQDQLSALEGTAQQQVRLQRHKNKRLLPYQFFDNNEKSGHKRNTFM